MLYIPSCGNKVVLPIYNPIEAFVLKSKMNHGGRNFMNHEMKLVMAATQHNSSKLMALPSYWLRHMGPVT